MDAQGRGRPRSGRGTLIATVFCRPPCEGCRQQPADMEPGLYCRRLTDWGIRGPALADAPTPGRPSPVTLPPPKGQPLSLSASERLEVMQTGMRLPAVPAISPLRKS